MALANFTDLESAIQTSLRRTSFDVTDSVLLAEATFNRIGVRDSWYQMEEETSLTTDSDGNATLPSDFLAVKSLRRTGSPNIELDAISMGTENRLSPYDTAGVARFYSVSGTTLRVTPIEAGTDLLTLTYFEKIPPLEANSTNWLMTLAPDAYLMMSLAEAHRFVLHEFEKAAAFEAEAARILADVGSTSTLARYGNAGIVNTDVPIA